MRHPGPILAEAAATLGWTVDQVATDGSPEKVQGAIDAAIRNGSDAVILNAADQDAYAKQIADAETAGVQFVTCCSLATAGDGILYNTATDKQNGPIGDNLAAEVVSDSGGKADVLYVNISAFQILAQVGQTFEDGHEEVLPVVLRRQHRHPADVARQGRAGPDHLLPAQPPGRELPRAVGD